jgi:PAS domain S-box-containing protein
MFDKSPVAHNMKASDYASIFEGIMRYSKDGLFITDHEGTVVMVNRATEEMVDFDASTILGRNARELVATGYYDTSVSLEVLKKKRPVSMIQVTRNGKRILATGIPIFGEKGDIRFVLVNDRDITSLENLTESLEQELLERDVRYEFSDMGLAATELQDFVIKSPAMHKVMKTAVRAAKFDLTLVITGQSGVGKSMIARTVHRLSERRNGKFIDVNCGAISDTLLESELFGHEKGAFTGASPTGKKGLFELAHNGSLFLDEVGEIPLHLQVKLLRFLEGGEIVRVGGLKSIKINTRVIAATNRNLEEMVENGRFRSDLYYRLNVVPLRIPSLAERREEISPLIDFFLKRFNKEFKVGKELSRAARNTLMAYPFPGNIRELENLVKRLVAMTEEDDINVRNLPESLRQAVPEEGWDGPAPPGDYQEEVKRFEIRMIEEAVRKFGSQRKAAKELGLSQSTLSRKLKGL